MDGTEDYNIEIKSEALQEIIGRSPSWIIKWGITIFFVIILLLLAISYLIKFPETISSRVVLTSKNAPVSIVAKTSGRIHFKVDNKQKVMMNQTLGYIVNTANPEDILILKKELVGLKKKLYRDQLMVNIQQVKLPTDLILGDLQPQYRSLLTSIQNLQLNLFLRSSEKQIQGLDQQLVYNNNITLQARKRQALFKADESLIQKKFTTDSLLFAGKVITRFEYDDAKRNLIQAKITNENANSTTTNNLIQISMLESQIIEIRNADQSAKKSLSLAIESAIKEMEHQIDEWDNKYLLTAPYDGEINFAAQWSNEQTVNLNDEIMRIVPLNNTLFCKALVPIINSGKMAKGQTANIRIDNYPYTDYGMIKAKVQSISSVPINNFYIVSLELPNGLITNYHKHLAFKQEMQGSAEIITEDRTILGSIFNKLTSLITANK